MITVYAANELFKQAYKVQRKLCRGKHIVYDLGGLGIGIDRPESVEGWKYKPSIIENALDERGEDTLYLDCDAFPLLSLEHVFDMWDFDVALTVRHPRSLNGKSDDSKRFMGWCNAGVVFARPSGVGFISQWRDAIERGAETDQNALNDMVGVDRPDDFEVRKVCGSNILFLPDRVYNYTGSILLKPQECRVLHLTGGRWKKQIDSLRVLSGLSLPREYR